MEGKVEKRSESLKSAERKDSRRRSQSDKKQAGGFPRKHNVIVVRKDQSFKNIVYRAKAILKNQFDSVELHGVDARSYLTVLLVA